MRGRVGVLVGVVVLPAVGGASGCAVDGASEFAVGGASGCADCDVLVGA